MAGNGRLQELSAVQIRGGVNPAESSGMHEIKAAAPRWCGRLYYLTPRYGELPSLISNETGQWETAGKLFMVPRSSF